MQEQQNIESERLRTRMASGQCEGRVDPPYLPSYNTVTRMLVFFSALCVTGLAASVTYHQDKWVVPALGVALFMGTTAAIMFYKRERRNGSPNTYGEVEEDQRNGPRPPNV